MRITYSQNVAIKCPVNGEVIITHVEITSDTPIMVEEIQAEFGRLVNRGQAWTQEEFTAQLAETFPVERIFTKAIHSGMTIVCET